jgi:hypothetical protein
MERIKRFLWAESPTFAPIVSISPEDIDENEALMGNEEREDHGEAPSPPEPPFSWIYYSIFTLLGIDMLWAW